MHDLDDLDKHMTESDWDQFSTNERLPRTISDKMLQTIESSIEKKKRTRIRTLRIRWTAAAAACLLLNIGLWQWGKNIPHPSVPKTQNIVAATKPQWQEKTNHTGKTLQLTLPDSSTVQLSANSAIRYPEKLKGPGRDIWLQGQAVFNVAKDLAHPFSVHTPGFTTTALGTVFRVSAFNRSPTLVTLLSGKVVVRPDSTTTGQKDAYLAPGQQWIFDPLKQMATVRNILPQHITHATPILTLTGKVFHFDNQTLAEIFNILEKEFHYDFIRKNSQIDDMRFTGTFDNGKETLESFIATLATLNDLTITKKNDSFVIK